MPIDHTSSATFSASPVGQNCEAGTVICTQLDKLYVGNVVHSVVTASLHSWIDQCESGFVRLVDIVVNCL